MNKKTTEIKSKCIDLQVPVVILIDTIQINKILKVKVSYLFGSVYEYDYRYL